MDSSKIAEICKLMEEYKFELDPDSIHDNVLCYICKNLMSDPCISVCGCHYCCKCITEYIGNSDKYCPGDKMKCKERYLNIEEEVFKDSRMKLLIFRSRVLCPNKSCDSRMELSQMREHLRVCTEPTVDCPFMSIGCDKGDKESDGILVHLRNDTLSHTELLMECIHNLRNEVCRINSRLEMSIVEITSVKDESKMKDIQIRGIREENEQIKKDAVDQIENLKKELTEERKENDTQRRLKEEEIREIKTEMAERKRETDDIRREIRILKGRIMWTQFCNVDRDMKSKLYRMKDERRGMNDLGATDKLCPIFNADFVWKIDGISKMKGNTIFSDSFHSCHYKFCLGLHHSVGTSGLILTEYLTLYCMLMRGNNDDNVEWPMRLPVTFSIINQVTMKTHKSDRIQYDTYQHNKSAFDRPQSDRNDWGICTNDTILYPSIINNRSIIVNDAIIVCCVIGDYA